MFAWPTSLRWLFVCFGAFLLLLALPATRADAQDSGDSPDEVVIFVMDLSGSMNEPFDGGQSKLDVAKAAFVEAFTNVKPDALVGLRVYGDQRPATAPGDREQNCTTDSRLVVPISPLQREQLISEVQQFSAVGDTAIGLALREANGDIPDNAVGTVVLFSDGRDECFDADLDGDPAVGPSYGEDPCEVAKEIGGGGDGLKINRVITVGFAADAAAEAELRCIADSTGGDYTAITTPEDARDVLPELLAELGSAREAERLRGIEVVGTPTREGAPVLPRLDEPGAGIGLYTDTISVNSQKVYRVEEYGPEKGTFTATIFGLPPDPGLKFDMRMIVVGSELTFFTDQGDPDAGRPERPTASIRCAGCFVSEGPHEVLWVVNLTSEDRNAEGTYELEIVTEGPGFGGEPTSCSEPQECWYPQEIDDRTAEVASLRSRLDERLAELAPQSLIDERTELTEEVAAADARVAASTARADELWARIDTAPSKGTSLGLPLLMILIGLVLGFVPIEKLIKRGTGDKSDEADANAGAVDPAAMHQSNPQAVEAYGAHVAAQVDPAANVVSTTAQEAAAREAVEAAMSLAQQEAQAPQAPPPGWYKDPVDPVLYRWWNGTVWTQDTSPDANGGL